MSEMPIEEEEIDEDASIDGWENVEKFINEDDESDFIYTARRRIPKFAGACVESKTTRNFKRETSSRVWKTVEIDGDLHHEEILIGSGGAETENEAQSMWTCGTLGKRMSAKIVARSQRRWERKSILEDK